MSERAILDPALMYSIKEIAAIFRVTPMSVVRWIKSGKLPAYQIGGTVRMLGKDVIEATKIVPRAEPKEKEGPRTPAKAYRPLG